MHYQSPNTRDCNILESEYAEHRLMLLPEWVEDVEESQRASTRLRKATMVLR